VTTGIGQPQTHRTRIAIRVPTASTHWLAAAYDRATASHWESAWETFVTAAVSRKSFSATDIEWLVQRSAGVMSLGHLPAESLARVLGVVAEREQDMRVLVRLALSNVFAHPAPGVRVAAMEAMLEVGVAEAKELASRVAESDHRSLREAADTVFSMVG